MDNTWNDIWRSDKYKSPQSRREKVSYKIELFQRLGANLSELKNVGDIGCGAGYFAKRLLSVVKGNIIGIDISHVAIGMARSFNNDPCIDYQIKDAVLSWQVPERLDAVFLVGLIEHVRRPEAVIKNAYDSLRAGGRLFLCSSNKHSVFHLEKCLLEAFNRWRLGYQKDYELCELTLLLSRQGFCIKRHYISGCIREGNMLSAFDRFLSRTIGWGRYIFVIAERM